MKRALAIVALAVVLPVLVGPAGAVQDLSLEDPPGAPIGMALCLASETPSCSTEAVTEVAPVATPAPVPAEVPSVPALVPDLGDDAYGDRLHVELCAARPVFCEVDRSGRFILQ